LVTRIHGKNTAVLMSATTTGPFVRLGSISQVDIERQPDRVDTTSFQDTNETSVKGFPKANVKMQGFYDLDDVTLKAARLVLTGVMVGVYPNYPTDLTKFYAVLADVDFDYSSGSRAAETITVTADARGSAIDQL
jgi:hypothetical protein